MPTGTVVFQINAESAEAIKNLGDIAALVRQGQEDARKAMKVSQDSERAMKAENAALKEQIGLKKDYRAALAADIKMVEREIELEKQYRHERTQRSAGIYQRGMAALDRGTATSRGPIGPEGGSISAMMASVAGWIPSLIGVTSVVAGLRLAISKLDEHIVGKAVAELQAAHNAEAASVAGIDFAAQNAKAGKSGKDFVLSTYRMGIDLGMNQAQIASMANPIQASVKQDKLGMPDASDPKGMETFNTAITVAAGLKNLGTSIEDAGLIVAQGITKGVDPRVIGTIFETTSLASKLGAAQTAAAAAGTNQYTTPQMGFAAIAAISGEENPERVRTDVESAQHAIGPGAVNSKLVKRFGLKGLNEEQAIYKLRQAGEFASGMNMQRGDGETKEAFADRLAVEFSKSLQKYEVEIRGARGLGILMRQAETMSSTLDKFESIPSTTDMVSDTYKNLREQYPGIESEAQGRIGAAGLAYNQAYGPNAEKNFARIRQQRDIGYAYNKMGMPELQDQTTGEANNASATTFGVKSQWWDSWGIRMGGNLKGRDNPFTTDVEGPAVPGTQTRRQQDAGMIDPAPLEKLNKNIETLNTALQQNTQTTAENTIASIMDADKIYRPPSINRNGNN